MRSLAQASPCSCARGTPADRARGGGGGIPRRNGLPAPHPARPPPSSHTWNIPVSLRGAARGRGSQAPRAEPTSTHLSGSGRSLSCPQPGAAGPGGGMGRTQLSFQPLSVTVSGDISFFSFSFFFSFFFFFNSVFFFPIFFKEEKTKTTKKKTCQSRTLKKNDFCFSYSVQRRSIFSR